MLTPNLGNPDKPASGGGSPIHVPVFDHQQDMAGPVCGRCGREITAEMWAADAACPIENAAQALQEITRRHFLPVLVEWRRLLDGCHLGPIEEWPQDPEHYEERDLP